MYDAQVNLEYLMCLFVPCVQQPETERIRKNTDWKMEILKWMHSCILLECKIYIEWNCVNFIFKFIWVLTSREDRLWYKGPTTWLTSWQTWLERSALPKDTHVFHNGTTTKTWTCPYRYIVWCVACDSLALL